MSFEQNHVLVADDEPEVRRLTARALRSNGMTCDLASDGDEAFQLICNRHYNAILTDLKMPRRHGHALCLDVMNLPSPPGVMVMTGLADARLVRGLMEIGVYDVAQKPVNYDVLAIKVRSMIEYGRTRQAQMPVVAPTAPVEKKTNLLHEIEDALVELTNLSGEKLDNAFESSTKMADPPKSIRDFIRRLAEEEENGEILTHKGSPTGQQRRQSDRVICYTTATAVPVDEHGKKLGEPFKIALRDLSKSGGRLLYTRAINAQYLALTWSATQLVAQNIAVLFRLARCKPCGPFYDLGGQFVMPG